MGVYDRFADYVKICTSSDRNSDTTPSSLCQFDLAHELVFEMKEMGISSAFVDNYCFVYGYLPPSPGFEKVPHVGFIAHLDTHPDVSGKNVRMQRIEQYDGKDVRLGDSGLWLTTEDFPHLKGLKGRTLLTTDGTTLLGADNKAAIAEIMTALDTLICGDIPHGPVSVAFVPDEEIGCRMTHFDFQVFQADFAFTLDGWEEGEISFENFNAARVIIDIRGVQVHQGEAKGQMVNSQLIGIEINNRLPKDEISIYSSGNQGYFHLHRFQGTVEHTTLVYDVRDCEETGFQRRLECLKSAAGEMNRIYGADLVSIEITEQYRNMRDKIPEYVVGYAVNGTKMAGLEPKIRFLRGGTDGAGLSARGLPCPNLGAGGYAYHSKKEHITVEAMEYATQIILEIVKQCRQEADQMKEGGISVSG